MLQIAVTDRLVVVFLKDFLPRDKHSFVPAVNAAIEYSVGGLVRKFYKKNLNGFSNDCDKLRAIQGVQSAGTWLVYLSLYLNEPNDPSDFFHMLSSRKTNEDKCTNEDELMNKQTVMWCLQR